MILRKLVLAAGIALAASMAMAQSAAPPMPEAIKPIRMSGVGLRVSNLERSMKFYTEVLGFKVDARVPATGAAREYLLGFTGNTQADNLVVISQGEIQPGATTFGRIVIVVPNARAMAERVKANGGSAERIVDGTNIVKDPDGYTIELYQRPAAPAR